MATIIAVGNVKWYEEIFLPQKNKETERLGRPLSMEEQISLASKLIHGIIIQELKTT